MDPGRERSAVRRDPDLRLHGQSEAEQRMERHLVPVRSDHHRQERPAQPRHRPGRCRLRRSAVQLQRHQCRAPTNFAINGTSRIGAHQPPITVLTSPAAGAVHSRGDAVPLADIALAMGSYAELLE